VAVSFRYELGVFIGWLVVVMNWFDGIADGDSQKGGAYVILYGFGGCLARCINYGLYAWKLSRIRSMQL